jgi:hypothetical protein
MDAPAALATAMSESESNNKTAHGALAASAQASGLEGVAPPGAGHHVKAESLSR